MSATKQDRHPSLWMYLLRRFAPIFVVAGAIGYATSFLRANSPSLFDSLSFLTGIAFGLVALLYFYWAVEPAKKATWSLLERIGVALSGVGALLIGAKLTLPDQFPGSFLFYFLVGAGLAFIGRPILDHLGWKHGRR